MSEGTNRRVYLDFVGCRLNQAEIERMGRAFSGRGDDIADSAVDADLVVINTCAVTNEAAKKSRRMIRQAGRANPETQIVVTGCYSELDPETLAGLPNVSQVISNIEKDMLVPLVSDDMLDYEQEPVIREPLPPGTLGRTRAFVKVQDGCDNRCTFCITTVARGKGRSRQLAEIISEVNLLYDLGYQEVVLTGVHLGSYGHDQGNYNGLFDLVHAILQQTAIPRVRLSSLEPWDLSSDFFDLWSDDRLCPHLHLPLQSGSDTVLRRMARRTTQQSFMQLVDAARQRIPEVAITTDVIAGFPGETDAEFDESFRFIEAVGFTRLHVFPYSVREGTAAARMPDQVSSQVKKERRTRLLELSDRLWADFGNNHIGRDYDVLWESVQGATPDGLIWSGLTGNYLRVLVTSPHQLANTISRVRLIGIDNGVLKGEVVVG